MRASALAFDASPTRKPQCKCTEFTTQKARG
jgi:hypothetical protein